MVGLKMSDLAWPVWLKEQIHKQWKYADLSFLQQKRALSVASDPTACLRDALLQHYLHQNEVITLVLVNGYFMPELSNLSKLPAKVIACGLRDAQRLHADLVKPYFDDDVKTNAFARMNASMFDDGVFVFIPDQCELTVPIQVLCVANLAHATISQPRHLIHVGKNSRLTFIEEHMALTSTDYMKNMLTTIHVESAGKIDYYKVQNESPQAIHLANTFIYQKQDSSVTLTNFSYGAQFARDDVIASLQEPGADCRTAGFYRLKTDKQYIDNHITIDHIAPFTSSEMLYKGIIENKSRAVFNGRLHVASLAKKILAYQANHNLLLSNQAEVYTKPELEIYADDVKCKHGATVGQLDQDALFYLQSRGINKLDAMHILLQGFARDIIERIADPAIKTHIEKKVNEQ
jgi:Fe-S cluster assembly protein SufD